jgi:hypothetical protein
MATGRALPPPEIGGPMEPLRQLAEPQANRGHVQLALWCEAVGPALTQSAHSRTF